jgi:hypothetical protein
VCIEGEISIAFTTSSALDINIDKIKLPMSIHFLLCNTCYWCASDIGSKSKCTKCPSCTGVEVESMPIAKNELCKFDYHSKRGITLEFSNIKNSNSNK